MRQFPIRPALTILTFAAMLAITAWLRKDFLGSEPQPKAPPPPVAWIEPSYLEGSEGALAHFYAALWRTEKKEPGAVTRIVHYGDSPTTADLITADVRALMQARFGDAGHGFTLAAKPWAWYEHRGVQVSGSGWEIQTPIHPELADRMYGLGGVAFLSAGTAASRFVLKDRWYTSVEVWFLRQPGGGRLVLSTGGQVETGAEVKEPGFAAFALEPPVGELEIRAEGRVRLFGITLEKRGPGVVYDSLGLNGAFTTILAHTFDERHWAEQLQHRRPDLVILNYGTNESGFAAYVDGLYEKELREAVRRLRAALPECSLLIMSPMDRAERTNGDDIQTLASIPRLVEIQRRVARETGCAFFNTFAAMGGEGTAARWYAARPRLMSADFIHPLPAGGRLVGEQFFRALTSGLDEYKLRCITMK